MTLSWGWEADAPIQTGGRMVRCMDDDDDWEERAWQDDAYDEPDELDGFEEEDWDDDDDDDDDDDLDLDDDDDDL